MLVGLTGNIGSGKTTVLGLFEALGARVISADEIVGRLLGEEDIRTKIRAAIGSDVFSVDGSLDRKKTAKVVFDNEGLRRKLEGIVHPAVMREIKQFALPDEMTIAEIPLLFEGGFTGEVNVVVTVTAPKEIVYERLGKKGKLSEEDITKRLACQIPDEQKAASSDFVIINAKDIASTRQQVKEIYRLLKLRHRRNV
ncbi:dephospho-CoA kinase [Candidatus Magnetominusculus dajiuhuensis]|uniref:dephospho-CoA kinase n=1 Tax=Candidatus Magnetominusculus dajiuhuensis TaxID=3137712 RepID=UPI003B4318ED